MPASADLARERAGRITRRRSPSPHPRALPAAPHRLKFSGPLPNVPSAHRALRRPSDRPSPPGLPMGRPRPTSSLPVFSSRAGLAPTPRPSAPPPFELPPRRTGAGTPLVTIGPHTSPSCGPRPPGPVRVPQALYAPRSPCTPANVRPTRPPSLSPPRGHPSDVIRHPLTRQPRSCAPEDPRSR